MGNAAEWEVVIPRDVEMRMKCDRGARGMAGDFGGVLGRMDETQVVRGSGWVRRGACKEARGSAGMAEEVG